MLAFITQIYTKFLAFMTHWKVWQIVLFALSLPIIALAVQTITYSSRYVYRRAFARLKKFLKRNSYLSPDTMHSFNKRVVKIFPANIKRQTKHIADSGMPVEEYVNTFGFCYGVSKKSIVGKVALLHTVLLGIIVAMNGHAIGNVCASVMAMALVWGIAKIIDSAFRGAYSFVDKKYRKKFISKLDSNTMLYSKNIDLTVPQRDGDGSDSVSELAKSVEDFLATSPDRSLAKVVLKGLYSAKFSSAMSIQNKLRLKNVIDDLKNYVG